MKKISTILAKNTATSGVIKLKYGMIEKKSDKSYTWALRFTILNVKDIRYYYTEEDFKERTD